MTRPAPAPGADRDQVFVIQVRVNDVTWSEAQSVTYALQEAARIAVRTVLEHNLEHPVEVVAPHVVHRNARSPRGFYQP